MLIVFVFADSKSETNCSLFNCIYPAKAINKLGGKHKATVFYMEDFNKKTEEVQKACNEADLIIIERNLFGTALLVELELWLKNKNLAVTFDDSYDKMCADNAAFSFWHDSEVMGKKEDGSMQKLKILPETIKQLKLGVRISKGLICPSQVLCDDWKHLAKTYRIHNYIDEERYPSTATPLFPHDKSEIYIGWCGSLSHLNSFVNSGVLQVLTYVGRKYDNVKILLTGDKRNFDSLNLPSSKRVYSNFVPDNQYSSLLRSLDIGIAPLHSEYDRRRSWIKVLEYMYLKIPWIATNYETYHEFEGYGKLIENGVENWKTALCDMVENIGKAREFANGKPYEFALTQTYDKNVDKLLATYQQIIDSEYEI